MMEYLPGGSLHERLQRAGRLPIPEACRYGAEIAAALGAAAEKGLIHRDVKPYNVLLDAVGHAKLGDFGLAKVLERTGDFNSRTAGTPDYMAPEQFSHHTITAKADIYALGCTLFHLLTGKAPFFGSSEQIMYAHLSAPPPKLRNALPRASVELERLLLRMMAKDPVKRPAGDEVARELRKIASGLNENSRSSKSALRIDLHPFSNPFVFLPFSLLLIIVVFVVFYFINSLELIIKVIFLVIHVN
jgi:serine/threonine-protein kinase